MEPDYRALARAWVEGDPRCRNLGRDDPDRPTRLASRLAEALEKRRREVATDSSAEAGDLVIQVDRSRFLPGAGLDAEALEEVARHLEDFVAGGEGQGPGLDLPGAENLGFSPPGASGRS